MKTCNTADERCFSGTVSTKNSGEASGRTQFRTGLPLYAHERLSICSVAISYSFERIRRKNRNGTPITDVTIPTGSVAPSESSLEMTDAASIRMLPMIEELIIRNL